jgi:bidirectional [NiFe] hydrogenase diaphorase subunit
MTLEELEQIAKSVHQENEKYDYEVNVCMDLACASQGADKLREALIKAAQDCGKKVLVRKTGCMGPCSCGPLVRVEPDDTLYGHVPEAKAEEIVARLGEEPLPELQCELNEHFDKQVRVVLENAGYIDPEKIDDYISRDGYKALLTALLEMTPAGIVHRITESGLRGRGGGGYPTGLKWSTVAKAGGDQKYVVCNGDEGDPGAFMDRSVMEGDPHRILEGMAIAAYAVGASKGFIYVRAEYPIAVARLTTAIREARRRGLLGNAIGGTTFNFDIEIRLGAGAFVCGEETALLTSIEGRRGTPRPRPPYPAVSGLWGKPTLINNVETYANIAPIVRNGGKWFFNMGSERSKGTKVFALTGRIKNTGLIEVPLGIKLWEIIEVIGGGVPGGHKLKAIQTGGPSGGCIPADMLSLGVSYDALMAAGSIMGSGGMIVMDDTSCMVNVARFFVEFCMTESCGKCIPCRAGTAQMHNLLTRICSGTATLDELDLLEELCDTVKSTSLCGLGQTAPNPVLSTLKYFREEYIEHIVHKRCPAGVCAGLEPAPAEPAVEVLA